MLTSDDRSAAQLPAVRVLAQWVRDRFPVSSVGTTRGAAVQRPFRTASGELRRRDTHEQGRAIDAMVPLRVTGDAIANLLVRWAKELGISLVVWNGLEWSPSPYGAVWESIPAGPGDHSDHVHADVSAERAGDAAAMRSALARLDALHAQLGTWEAVALYAPSSSSATAVVLGAFAAAGGALWWLSKRR